LITSIVESSDTLSTFIDDLSNVESISDLESVINAAPGFAIESNYNGDNTLESVSIAAEATEEQYNILEANNLVHINVNEDGSYSITTPFVDALAGDENADITFAYDATDNSGAQNATSESATVTVNVDGVNDEPVVGTVSTDQAIIGMFDIDGGNVDLSNVVAMSDLDKINGIVVSGRTELDISVEDVLDVAANDNTITISSSDHLADAVHLGDNFDLANSVDNGNGTHTYSGSIDVSGTTETVSVIIDDTIVVD
jgi:VCBS repeat-containing protein